MGEEVKEWIPETQGIAQYDMGSVGPRRIDILAVNHKPRNSGACWSLIAPNWQKGSPTEEQIRAWPWWFVVSEETFAMAGKMAVTHTVTPADIEGAIRSAPIQPDLSMGPRWVPLSVARTEPQTVAEPVDVGSEPG